MDEIPRAISLWSTEGHHAGFMLCSYEQGNTGGSCVFMLTPISIEGVNSDMGIIVSELKTDGEQIFIVTKADNDFELTVLSERLPELVIQFDSSFKGKIFTELDKKLKCVGTAEAVEQNV
ncbi:MAG: hypothetical protein AAF485_20755 [Chloroflexota bacterium]